ncbi:50S ribosomal protein L2 [Paenibacillus sp. GCM10012307]|uniref:Large ribosomal subunit protein uL2 n=1 Tax=Paenibacillus roseus TaxID=2798579 RepID=A0A934JBH2_9BACL|nr:50S ribosomal protein L2 [Paenibacillus roseus]MBJ6363763.1 50S ribosomal protein L2 [Paenibacillus roseus]
MRHFRAITPGRRHKLSLNLTRILTKNLKPLKKNSFGFLRSKGRNNRGIITSRHRGGGCKRIYRIINFKYSKIGVPGKIKTIEYDPNRNCLISLVHYIDGDKQYILTFQNLYIGKIILSSPKAYLSEGNSLPLKYIPIGFTAHNIEFHPNKGGQLARSAGTKVTLLFKYKNYIALRLPSGKKRFFPDSCWATIGVLGNQKKKLIVLGKAGSARWLGQRPHVRGSAMNAVDHPHGGGEGKAPIGRKHPYTPWGKPALGVKTRKLRKWSDLYLKRFKSRK